MTLAEFLLARIAEDEAAAREPRWLALEYGVDSAGRNAFSTRVLAECEAKRLRLKIADDLEAEADDNTYRWAHSVAEQIRKVEALPYADHPDYRDEWKP